MRITATTALAAVIVSALIAVAPAAAAAPGNDTFAGATAISTLPFADSVDTSSATTDSADVAATNAGCFPPATEASVWYAYSAATSTSVSVDVSGSTYSAGVIVVTGTPGGFTMITCGPGSVGFTADPGVTYYLLAFDDTVGNGNGGTLDLRVSEAVPPAAEVMVNPVATVDARSGQASVSGSFRCSGIGDLSLGLSLTQTVGRFAVTGFGGALLGPCDGSDHEFSLAVAPSGGKFAGGRATVSGSYFGCGTLSCIGAPVNANVRLRR